MTMNENNMIGGKPKVNMALWCYFFGALGVHNFMLGENKKGILKLVLTLCTGIGVILGAIDFVRIVCDAYEVNPEKFI